MNQQPAFTSLFLSSAFTRQYLKNSYEKRHINKPAEKAYQNSYACVYYVEMGNQYFQQGQKAPLTIQPVLLFYGLSHWLKAALLTVDPDYPATTQVLAHGLSARKKKKQGYQFLSDDVRIQKEGLFPYLSEKLFHVKQISGEKVKMRYLLLSLPEMQPLFQTVFKEPGLQQLTPETDSSFTLPLEAFSDWPDTLNTWVRQLSTDINGTVSCRKEENLLYMTLSSLPSQEACFFRQGIDGSYYAPVIQPLFNMTYPELLVHYMLLYQLSMICRYEIEWWGELNYTFSSNDLPIIKEFLNITQLKSKQLLEMFFLE
ncbi:YaaC family protein [Salipaludibacillus aurantiacus]|uniref:YaaC-like Protein n=1 Tax=Salipaludibacillus aurantiacus TaxID=1601833 RepID=A0A1H9X898_9BACI|nr:YaaC family protein [Salipaludibacillus aurantiacus]SES42299.1 YaaC-like Protein [Salipaludibacillus aurantiacus]